MSKENSDCVCTGCVQQWWGNQKHLSALFKKNICILRQEVEEDVLRSVLRHFRLRSGLPDHGARPAGGLQGGPREPDRERGPDQRGERGGPGAGAELPHVVEGPGLGAQLSAEAPPRRRQQDAQAEERGLHEGQGPSLSRLRDGGPVLRSFSRFRNPRWNPSRVGVGGGFRLVQSNGREEEKEFRCLFPVCRHTNSRIWTLKRQSHEQQF